MLSKQVLPHRFGQGRVVFCLKLSSAVALQSPHFAFSSLPSAYPFSQHLVSQKGAWDSVPSGTKCPRHVSGDLRTSENYYSRNCLIIPGEPRFGVLGEVQQGRKRCLSAVLATQGSSPRAPKRIIRQSRNKYSRKFATCKQRQVTAKIRHLADVPERTIRYRASQQWAEAQNRVPQKVGTHGAWEASGATGCRTI